MATAQRETWFCGQGRGARNSPQLSATSPPAFIKMNEEKAAPSQQCILHRTWSAPPESSLYPPPCCFQ